MVHASTHARPSPGEIRKVLVIRPRFVGDVFGSALAAEGVFAFFLESGFLAVLLYGWDRVSRGFHFFATLMVALGSIFSSVWIVVANSWQQTPTGHHIVPMLRDGKPWIVQGEPVLRAGERRP